jgi:phosphoserine phosphatase RsbU/P
MSSVVVNAPDQETELRLYIQSIVHGWAKTLAALAFSLVPVFFLLDVFMMPAELLPRFAAYRLAATVIMIIQYFVIRSTRPGRWSIAHGFIESFVVAGMIALMTTYLGGFNSSYYAGLNLVLIAVNLALPWRWVHSIANSLLVLGLYVGLNLLIPQAQPIDLRILLNNMYFLVATAVITVAMNWVQHRLIRQEFLLRSELKQARDALWGEMEIAKHIQTSLLPRVHELRGYAVGATMLPATEVGGDYYDIIANGSDETWLCIGDVSGHGVASGLVMMMTQTSIRTAVTGKAGQTPKTVLEHVNYVIKQNISRLATDRYMTLCLMKLTDTRIAFAGRHQDLLIYRERTGTVDAVATEGAWIGVRDSIASATTDRSVELSSGDVVLLFTDGITEAMNQSGQLFGESRLRQSLARHAHLPVDDIVTNLVRDVRGFMHRQEDDLSLLVLKRTA